MQRSEKAVLITGCSTGIGNATAKALVKRGYRVFACARKERDVARLRAEGLEGVRLDLRSGDSIQAALREILELTENRLYALFNNGAYGQPGAVEDLSTDVLRAQFETNFFGWHELTCQILPVMRKQGRGRIIQNSSVLGLFAMKYRGAYTASKFALEGLTDTLRLELAGTDIHVSLIEPGPIQSAFRQNALDAFQNNIDIENSVHREVYASVLRRLNHSGKEPPFTLPPEAILKPVLHALESRRPRARYPVTVPTRVFALMRRVLPVRWLDWISLAASRGEHRDDAAYNR